MPAVKTRISVTILPQLAQILEEMTEQEQTSRSAVVEKALKSLYEEKMAEDANKLAQLNFDDLPAEDDWVQIQSEY